MLPAAPVVYEKQGYRLLAVSRTVLRRVIFFSVQFHLTGDRAFAQRAEKEMLTAAAFGDWNPAHFLDTAEMTAALALGYDWLFDELNDDSRAKIRAAIVELGLKPGLAKPWEGTVNNWNAVCLGSLAMGALAIADAEPDVARRTLEMVKHENPAGQVAYAPDGVYPEGPMYWGYGTSYEVMLLASLESALGTDWGIGASPGFMESAAAFCQTISPSGRAYNFFDGVERTGIEPALFWFARKLHKPQLLNRQRVILQKYVESGGKNNSEGMRYSPLAALWWPEASLAPAPPLPLHWLGRGRNPLAVFRTDWDDPQAMYLALKGGKASLAHGHMDAGSFVFDSDGVRWAKDLGMQDYNSLESKGIRMWNASQTGQRWSVFRYNNFSHNTLTLDGELHHADGQATITRFLDKPEQAGAVVDLTPVFGAQATKVTRGFVFRPKQHVCIVDELEGLRPGTIVRWTMATGAAISIEGGNAVLKQDGQTMRISLATPNGVPFEVASADPSADGFNAPNPGIQLLVANFKAPESGQVRISVTLQPGEASDAPDPLLSLPLAQWPHTPVPPAKLR